MNENVNRLIELFDNKELVDLLDEIDSLAYVIGNASISYHASCLASIGSNRKEYLKDIICDIEPNIDSELEAYKDYLLTGGNV